MEKGNFEKIYQMIEGIEEKNSQLEKYLKNLPFSSRNKMLKEIVRDVVSNNELIKQLGIPIETMYTKETVTESLIENVVADIVVNIQNNETKKVIYLREFLSMFQEISENDKSVILQSLKDEKVDKLKEKMLSLVNMFNLRI
jgi:hypothetical protein